MVKNKKNNIKQYKHVTFLIKKTKTNDKITQHHLNPIHEIKELII